MTLRAPIYITATCLLTVTCLFWLSLLLTLLGVTDLFRTLIAADGSASLVYAMIALPAVAVVMVVISARTQDAPRLSRLAILLGAAVFFLLWILASLANS